MATPSSQIEPWKADRDLELSQVRMMAEAFLPNLPLYEIRFIGSGWCNDVYNLNSEWILRFPRRMDVLSNLKKETRLSPFLISNLRDTGVLIPNVVTVSPPEDCGFPYPFGAYRMIPGTSGGTKVGPITDWSKFAKTLGYFLTTLHSISKSNMDILDVHVQRNLSLQVYLDRKDHITKFIDSLQDGELSGNAEWLIASKLPEPYLGQLRFTHNDLCPEHILIDRRDGSITGIIDWEDATVGDPVSDFVTLPFWIGWNNTQLVIDNYRLEIDSGFPERLEFAAKVLSLAWLYEESRRSGNISLQKWYVKNVFSR